MALQCCHPSLELGDVVLFCQDTLTPDHLCGDTRSKWHLSSLGQGETQEVHIFWIQLRRTLPADPKHVRRRGHVSADKDPACPALEVMQDKVALEWLMQELQFARGPQRSDKQKCLFHQQMWMSHPTYPAT